MGDFVVVPAPGPSADIFPGRHVTFEAVLSALMRHRDDAFAVAKLRHAAVELDVGAERLDDTELLARVARQIDFGRWQLERNDENRPPLDPQEVTDLNDLRPPPTDDPVVEQTHHVEIQLVGDDDAPIIGERYRVELPNGRVVEGRTGDGGTAYIDGISRAGTCKVSFPDRDADAWEPA